MQHRQFVRGAAVGFAQRADFEDGRFDSARDGFDGRRHCIA